MYLRQIGCEYVDFICVALVNKGMNFGVPQISAIP